METIYSKEELKNAINSKQRTIIVGGDLAKKIRKKKQRSKIMKITGGTMLLGSLVALPFTGGASTAGVAAGAALTAGSLTISTAELAIIVGGGIALYGIKKGYNIAYKPDGTVILTAR